MVVLCAPPQGPKRGARQIHRAPRAHCLSPHRSNAPVNTAVMATNDSADSHRWPSMISQGEGCATCLATQPNYPLNFSFFSKPAGAACEHPRCAEMVSAAHAAATAEDDKHPYRRRRRPHSSPLRHHATVPERSHDDRWVREGSTSLLSPSRGACRSEFPRSLRCLPSSA